MLVGVLVGALVCVLVGVCVAVLVEVRVGVLVRVPVAVMLGVAVGVLVLVTVGVLVLVSVGVGVLGASSIADDCVAAPASPLSQLVSATSPPVTRRNPATSSILSGVSSLLCAAICTSNSISQPLSTGVSPAS